MVYILILLISIGYAVEFDYPVYTFRRKSHWARQYNNIEFECKKTCHVSDIALYEFTIDQLKCVRMCASKKCYDEIYGWNELEPGEVDVRISSFKGCAAEELKKKAQREL